jgi:transglutaminase-like putative cysteine protease
MELIARAAMSAYLEPATLIDRDDPAIVAWVDEHLGGCSPEEAARRVFHFVRDEVAHSWDIQGTEVARSASDALRLREGICYPKSHLIAALLRRAGIPTAICYQRLTLDDNDDSKGYAVHALNAVHINGRWSRIDARGNKPGVDAQFSLTEERLAFAIRKQYGEVDYPYLFAEPHPVIVHTLLANDNALEMYERRLPSVIPSAVEG